MLEYKKIEFDENLLRMIKYSYFNNSFFNNFRKIETQENLKNNIVEIFGVFLDGKLTAAYYLYDFKMRFRNSIIKAGGIGTVCSDAINRGKGAVKFLLQNSLKSMQEREQIVSVLYPFDIGFYKKYGWGCFSDYYNYHIATTLIKKYPMDFSYGIENIWEIDDETIDYYNEYARKNHTLVLKDRGIWERELRNNFSFYVDRRIVKFKKNDKLCGLLKMTMYNDKVNGDGKLIISHLVYDDLETLHQIMNFLSSLSLQIKEIIIELPLDFNIAPFLKDRAEKIELDQSSMIRINNISLLNGLEIDCEDTKIDIKINDDLEEKNNGNFSLIINDKRMKIEKVKDGFADCKTSLIECDINVFSSIISGYTNFSEAIKYGEAKLLKEENFIDLPKQVNFFPFYF